MLLFIALAWGFFSISADDAFIVARYAQNFNAGYGLVYNPGEQINALTSPLHFFVFVLLRKFTVDVVLIYKFLAAIAVCLTLIWVGQKQFADVTLRTLFWALTLLSPFLIFWTVGGLETPLLLIFLCLTTFFALQLPNSPHAKPELILVFATLGFLTRYDSVLFFIPIVSYVLFVYRRTPRVWVVACLMASGAAAWMLFSFYYFGDFLPTSFYTKSPLSLSESTLLKGGFYTFNFLLLSFILPLPLLFRLNHPSPIMRIIYMGLALFLVYGVLAGTKHMMYGYRLFVPFIPVFVLVAMAASKGSRLLRPEFLLAPIIIFQVSLAVFIYHKSQNPNLTLLWKNQNVSDEIYEFSTAGARMSREAAQVYRLNAQEIRQHWQTQVRDRPPRVFILPGGVMPYFYPEAYIYETLVSYRHRCSYVLFESADYLQLIYPAAQADYPTKVFEHRVANWERISAHKIVARGYAPPMELAIDLYYQRRPAPNRLPPKIYQSCV